MTESQLKIAYSEVIGEIYEVASSWVSGRGFPILKMMKHANLQPNSRFTKNFISNLSKLGIIELQQEDKDYIYRWSDKFTIEEAVKAMMELVVIDPKFSKGNHIYIMYNNQIHEGNVVEGTLDSVIVAVKTSDGLKSMTLTRDGLESLSASASMDEILDKLHNNSRTY